MVKEALRHPPFIYVCAKQREGHDADAVFNNRDRENDERQNNLFPEPVQEKMPGQNTGYEERQARAYTAAFLGYLYADPRKMEYKPFPLKRYSREDKEDLGGFRGPNLQGINNFIHDQTGDGDHKNQKKDRERGFLKTSNPIEKDKATCPENDGRKGKKRSVIVLI
jgi:hypothetical protein